MKRISFYLLLTAIVTFCAWLILRQPAQMPPQNVPSLAPLQSTNTVNAPLVSNASPKATPTTNNFVRPDWADKESWNLLMKARQMVLDQNQPVEFYARVVDESEMPVQGAILQLTLSRIDEKKFETTNFFHMKMGDEIVNVPIELKSDINGWVKLNGVAGETLRVQSLTKEGYSWTPPQIGSFGYGPEGKHLIGYAEMEDAYNPDKGYIFHLRNVEETNAVKSTK